MIGYSYWMALYVVITFVLTCLGGCAQGNAMQGDSLFEQYVLKFQPRPPGGSIIPALQPLPEKVYESAIALAEGDRPRFEDMVCLYLAKYHIYYLRHCHQAYSFLDPYEVRLVNPKCAQRDKYFMLNAFLEFSGYGIGEDGAPSSMVVFYCRAKPRQSGVIADLLREVADAERERDRVWK